mmetsp:Transcript_36001/g.84392  ORF Transcript_36001/g.84392 Transcript_36001/m.84392 type:complete len:421 (+) Transcript_36001:95-1357(+)
MEKVVQQLRTVSFQTGSFLVAWSWVLVYYATSHVVAGESPLEDQIGFGGKGRPHNLLVLVVEYLLVCGATAALLEKVRATDGNEALAAALEFFPSPVFSGKLLQYLGQFSRGGLELALLNLGATTAVAAAVHAAPRSGQFQAIGDIVRNTVGFGLGVAWNVLASSCEPGEGRLISRTVYLGIVVLLAARLAAPPPRFDSLRSRIAALGSFAARVVCAFALNDWLQAALPHGLLYSAASLVGLVLLAAQMAVLLAEADLDRAQAAAKTKAERTGWGSCILRMLVFIPCVWCCCPWVPLLWLLSNGSRGVTDRWTSLAADVCSLAASVAGTSLLTGMIDSAAAQLELCDAYACMHPIAFIALEAAAAFIVTMVLRQLLGWIKEGHQTVPIQEDPHDPVSAGGYAVLPPPPSDSIVVKATVVA